MKSLFITSLLSAGLAFSALGASDEQSNSKLKLGDAIPAVTAKDQNGQAVNLGESKTGYTLVYFYPKAMSPGCTAQACSLRDSYTELQEKGVKIYGVSIDTVEDQKKFADIDHLPFQLLADPGKKVIAAFGVPLLKNAFASRQAYLFKDGKLVWFDTKASTDAQAADVLKVLAKPS
ncbi:MAG TPA: peroxiredoxin [Chthoniobacterales bacterium]|jgi:thioredoxin-dependent peroxiredoxin